MKADHSGSSAGCLKQFKECLAMIVPRLIMRAGTAENSSYHDPNLSLPSGSPKQRSLKKKKYQRVDNPQSVSMPLETDQMQDEEEEGEDDDLEGGTGEARKRSSAGQSNTEETDSSVVEDPAVFFNEFSSWRTD